MRDIESFSFRHFERDCEMKTSEMLSFLPLKNNSVTIDLNCLLDSISAIISSNTINTLSFLSDYSLLNFQKHHQLFVNNQ